ncbi:MAG: hypothetical protein QF704_01890 [Anaerolineales bacterium]|nr:hypothetical protein [Anaerolineales bacterium]
MSDLIKHSKKVLSATLTVSTIVWSVGLFALAPASVGAAAGDLIKTAGDPAVYLVDADGVTIHPFPHANVYTSWGFPADFSTTFVTDLSGFSVGNDVEFRDGALIRALETPAVYVVSGEKLRPVLSAEVFETLGYNYDNITWLPQSFLDKYGAAGDMLSSTTTHPNGTLVKYASSSTVYLLEADQKRAFASSDVIAVNGYASIPVITIPSSETYSDGSKIVVKEASATVPDGVGAAPADTTPPSDDTPTAVGSGLTVALASDSTAAATIIVDSNSAGGAQAFVPMTKVALTAGSDGAVKLTTIKFLRGGISANADVSALYLFEGDEVDGSFIKASSSYSDGVATFTDSNGLITIPAGQTKYVMLRIDIANDVGSGKTMSFSTTSASDISTDGATVSGSFPVQGNIMSVAQASDVGYITVANVSPAAASTVDPGTDDHDGWRFSLAANDQDMEVRYLKISMTGSAAKADLKDFTLLQAGTAVSETVSALNDADEIVFQFPTPYLIEKGKTKNIDLNFDVVSGSSRTIHFQIQEMYHGNMYDKQYNVYSKLNQADTWTIIESNSSTTNTTINAGNLTVWKATDSPTGNIAVGASGLTLGKFNFKANGEDIRINSLVVSTPAALNGMNDVKIYYQGSQVGATTDTTDAADTATFSFGASVVIPAGTTEVIEVRGDTKNAAGTNYSASDSISVTLDAGSSNARALSSSTSISTPSIAGNTLTGAAGTLTLGENTAVNDASAASPSGVLGDQGVLIGSFVMTAGSGEGVSVSQVTLTDDVTSTAGSSLADTFQNLRLESGGPADESGNYATGTAIGSTRGSLTDTEDTTYNFNPSPNIELGAAKQIVVNIYADVLSSATTTQLATVNGDTDGIVYPSTVTATGNDTSSSANGSMSATTGLQRVHIASSGSLTIENVASSAQVKANIITAGTPDVELYKFKMTALTEDVDVTRLIVSQTIASGSVNATISDGKPTSTLTNFKLFDGSTQIGATLSSLSTATDNPVLGGYVDFNLGTANAYRISAGTEKTLTLKGSVNAWPGISSGSTHTFSLQANPLNESSVSTRAVTARGVGSSTAVNGPTSTATGNAHTVRRAYPLVERLALTSSTLNDGSTSQASVAKFKVTAVNGQVRIKKMTFSVSLTDTTTTTLLSLNNFKLYRDGTLMGAAEYSIYDGTGTLAADTLSPNDSGVAALSVSALSWQAGAAAANSRIPNTTSTYITLLLGARRTDIDEGDTGGSEEVIDSGTSNTYEMKLDVANANAGTPSTDADSITVQLLGDDTQTAPTTQNLTDLDMVTKDYRYGIVGLNSTNYNFIWSDYSANTNDHSALFIESGTGIDWTHGYQVPSSSTQDSFIPLDAWRLSSS